MGLIRWAEIAEVRSDSFLWNHFIGIVPRDTDALCRCVGPRGAWLIRMDAWCVALHRLFGVRVAPINIPHDGLTITADEMLTHIRSYQAAHLPPVAAEAGVWPPPPVGRQ